MYRSRLMAINKALNTIPTSSSSSSSSSASASAASARRSSTSSSSSLISSASNSLLLNNNSETTLSSVSTTPSHNKPTYHQRFFSYQPYNMGIKNIDNYENSLSLESADPTLQQGISSDEENSEHYPFKYNRHSSIKDILYGNKVTMDNLKSNNPEVMERSGAGQSPHTFWIGCSDSRINEATALGVLPGEVFTLRNIANIVTHQDFSTMGAIQFAIEVLKVRKIVVCGHTDCGGVWASLSSKKIGGVLDHWLNPIRHVRAHNLKLLKQIPDAFDKCTALSELNVINSVHVLKRHPSFIKAHKSGLVEVYGLIYDVKTGYLRELEIPIDDEFEDVFHVHEEDVEEDVKAH